MSKLLKRVLSRVNKSMIWTRNNGGQWDLPKPGVQVIAYILNHYEGKYPILVNYKETDSVCRHLWDDGFDYKEVSIGDWWAELPTRDDLEAYGDVVYNKPIPGEIIYE